MQCNAQVILIYSPDTDVYNIGLSHISQKPDTTYIMQINLPHSDEKIHQYKQPANIPAKRS